MASNLGAASVCVDDRDGVTRLSFEIDGAELWFESSDLALVPSVEGLGSLLLVPAILQGRNLELPGPVCSEWYANAGSIVEYAAEYWGNKPIAVLAEKRVDASERAEAIGQFFSGGVDSFFTLLTAEPRPGYLISVEGFDKDLQQSEAFADDRRRLHVVARNFGTRAVSVRTNFWDHPLSRAHVFYDTHLGVLAAIGHFLESSIGEATIAPSFPPSDPEANTAAWRTVPLWSSARLRMMHGDPSSKRIERLAVIAEEPLVWEHLRVCSRAPAQPGNCSRCEKCVRTMLELHLLELLDRFSVFDSSDSICERLDGVAYADNLTLYYETLETVGDRNLELAIRRLIRRSRVSRMELRAEQRRYREVNEDYERVRAGLENALYHYGLLQKEHEQLAADYYEVVGRLPIRRGIRAFRQALRFLRGRKGSATASGEP